MNLAVTVGAAPVEEEDRGAAARSGGVKSRLMALGADPRVSNFEESVVDRTVRLVAVGTILKDRRMLPEEGATPLRMALVTSLVHACPSKLRRVGRPVRVVTIGTSQLPFRKRHMRRALELSLSLEVALAANLRLRSLVEERSFVTDLGELKAVCGFLHDGVAIDAGDAATGMRARLPIGLHAPLMALEAGLILRLC